MSYIISYHKHLSQVLQGTSKSYTSKLLTIYVLKICHGLICPIQIERADFTTCSRVSQLSLLLLQLPFSISPSLSLPASPLSLFLATSATTACVFAIDTKIAVEKGKSIKVTTTSLDRCKRTWVGSSSRGGGGTLWR